MKIVRFEAENVKRLRAVAIEPSGNVVQIAGPNGAGKSSVLDAIFWALAGASGISSQPVRAGEESAVVKLDLGEIRVTRKFAADGKSTLIVEATNGARFPSPQRMLDELLGALTFDPLTFARMKPREQRDELAKLVGLSAQLEQITRQNAADMETRREVGKNGSTFVAQLKAIETTDEPLEPIDVAAVMAEIRVAEDHNQAVRYAVEEHHRERRRIAALRQDVADLRAEAARILAEADEHEARANAFEAKLGPEPTAEERDVESLRQRVLDAHRVNQELLRRERKALLAQDVENARTEYEAITQRIKAREDERRALIEATPMPIAGLGFNEDGVTYNGVPFDQASGAEQLRVSVAIAMAANPKLRVLRIKDGALLDEHSLALLEQMATAADYQVWIERVGDNGGVGILMEDGGVVAIDGTPVDVEPALAGVE